MSHKEYKIGDTYWYVAIGNYNRLKVYSIKICSDQDYGKGMARFDTRKEAEEYLELFKLPFIPSYWQLLGELEGTLQSILDNYSPTEDVRATLQKRIIQLKSILPEDVTVSVLSKMSERNMQ